MLGYLVSNYSENIFAAMPKCKNLADPKWVNEFDRLCKQFDDARQAYDDALRSRDIQVEQRTFAMILEAAGKLNELLPAPDEDIDELLM